MAEIKLEGPKARTLFFTKGVNLESIAKLTEDIISINKDDEYLQKTYALHDITYDPKPIEIYIDSYGGSVYQCFGLLSVMENSKTPIHTIVTGCAMSCGFMMLICGHKRFAHKLSTVMFHQVSHEIWGKITDLEQRLEEDKRLQKQLENITVDKTVISRKKIAENKKEKVDWFMSAEEALSLGVIDEII